MPRTPIHTRVETVERLTPHLVRIVVGGEELEGFGAGAFSDRYVKLKIGDRTRAYTVRDWDAERRRLTIDFVIHGARGLAGPWALAAKPGDPLVLTGPGGAYTPDPEADWHLMVGDEAVLPAIATSLERVRAGVPVVAVLEVAAEGERVGLDTPGDLRVRWLHRNEAGTPGLPEAVEALDWLDGAVHGFVHGEAGAVRAIRRHLLLDRGVPATALSISGYWKRALDDEAWRASKAEWNRQVELDTELTARRSRQTPPSRRAAAR